MPVAGVFLMAAMGGAAATAEPMQIKLADRQIRAGDLAVAEGFERVVVGTLPNGSNAVELSEDKVRSLVSNRLPAAKFTLRYSGPVRLSGPAPAAVAATCWQARQVIDAGSVILTDAVKETPCTDEPVSSSLSYSRARGKPIAARSIEAGSYLGAVRPAESEGIAAGRVLTFRTTQGPVTVERQVTALQNGAQGGKIFARTAEGEVISAPILAAPKENDK